MTHDEKTEVIFDFLKVIQNHLKSKTGWGRNQLMRDLRTLALEFLNGKGTRLSFNQTEEIPWPEMEDFFNAK